MLLDATKIGQPRTETKRAPADRWRRSTTQVTPLLSVGIHFQGEVRTAIYRIVGQLSPKSNIDPAIDFRAQNTGKKLCAMVL
jgi:hypothetical protein